MASVLPTIQDYQRGFYTRKFSVRRTDTDFFFESTGQIVDDTIWETFSIEWKLIGIFLPNKQGIQSIQEVNTEALQELSKNIPNIYFIAKNPYKYTLLWPYLKDTFIDELQRLNIITKKQAEITKLKNVTTLKNTVEERILEPPFKFKTIRGDRVDVPLNVRPSVDPVPIIPSNVTTRLAREVPAPPRQTDISPTIPFNETLAREIPAPPRQVGPLIPSFRNGPKTKDPRYGKFGKKISQQMVKDPKSGKFYRLNTNDIKKDPSNVKRFFRKDNRVNNPPKRSVPIVIDTRTVGQAPRIIKSKVKVEPRRNIMTIDVDISKLTNSSTTTQLVETQGLGVNRRII